MAVSKALGSPGAESAGSLGPEERRSAGLLAFFVTIHHELLHHFRFGRFGPRPTPPSMVAAVDRGAAVGQSGFALEDDHLGGVLKVWWKRGGRWRWDQLTAIGLENERGFHIFGEWLSLQAPRRVDFFQLAVPSISPFRTLRP